jgi:predicted lipoprotein with Yx(FWY)xxD motif
MRTALLCTTLVVVGLLLPDLAGAQPADLPIAPADGSALPKGVSVRKADGGKTRTSPVYVDRQGRVLYGMDMRTVLRWAPDPAQYCSGECATEWEPLLAPAGSAPNVRYPRDRNKLPEGFVDPQKAPDWTVIAGPAGPQWVYKGWHMVFVRRAADAKNTAFDGAQDRIWNTLKFVPKAPVPNGPVTVAVRFVDGAYALADKQGRLLFTGACPAPCAWQPLPAPMAASATTGPGGSREWTVLLLGDRPQWARKGKPVFVAEGSASASVPANAAILRP